MDRGRERKHFGDKGGRNRSRETEFFQKHNCQRAISFTNSVDLYPKIKSFLDGYLIETLIFKFRISTQGQNMPILVGPMRTVAQLSVILFSSFLFACAIQPYGSVFAQGTFVDFSI